MKSISDEALALSLRQFGNFGRRVSSDPRDNLFLLGTIFDQMGPLAQALPTKGVRYWTPGPIMNQGRTDSCVGHAWKGLLTASPVRVPAATPPGPFDIYNAAQIVDEFPDTPPAGGTSVRAGAKVLKSKGLIIDYRWAKNTTEVTQWLLSFGPMVVGTDWTAGMMRPNARTGFIYPTGASQGGHAYLLVGVDTTRGLYRIVNSWGTAWGIGGVALIKIDDFGYLLSRNGEAVAAREQPNGAG
jgi:hypothetical protein